MTMEDTELDIRGMVGLLRRQLRLIVVITLVVVGIAGIAVYSLTPKYSASALLLVDTSKKNLLDPGSVASAVEIDSAQVDSEMEILKSPAVLLKVIEEKALVRDEEFGAKLGLADQIMAFLQMAQPTPQSSEAALANVLSGFKRATSVERLGRTNLINATVTSEDPARAAELANVWADAYIREQVSAKVNSSLMSRDVLEARLVDSRDAVTSSEGAFDQYINDSLAQIVSETGRADIGSMRDQLESLAASQQANAQRAELARASLEQRDWTALATTLQSEALRELDRQQRELSTRIAVATASQSVDLSAELARIEQRMEDTATNGLTTLQQSIVAAEAQQGEVRQQLRAAVLSSALSPEILARIYELQQGSEVARAQYQTLLSRIKDAEAQAAVQVADSRVVSPALPPSRPSFPNVGLTMALALLGGAGLGVGLAFLRENLVGGIVTEEQAAAVLRAPVAAALPRERATSGSGGLADLMVTSALSSFPEGVRRIKAYIDQASHRRALRAGLPRSTTGGARVIMMTSSTANEGKSTIALSLARAYALARQRVVIIDCDLRKPSLHRMLELHPSPLLIDHLIDGDAELDLASLVAVDAATGLHVVIGAQPSDVPTDQLIAGPAFTRLLERIKGAYDVIILDTPPVGPVVDGLYLAQAADFIVFVLRAGTTSQTEARMALQSLRDSKAPDTEVFAVLNQQDRASATYKNKYQSYYSESA